LLLDQTTGIAAANKTRVAAAEHMNDHLTIFDQLAVILAHLVRRSWCGTNKLQRSKRKPAP
jgi:hypothetical protein